MSSCVAKRFLPLLDRVLVQRVKAEAQTKAGLFLPDSAKSTPNIAKVLAVGPGRMVKSSGELHPCSVKVGDEVVLPEYGGMPLKIEGESELQVFRDEDIIGILENN